MPAYAPRSAMPAGIGGKQGYAGPAKSFGHMRIARTMLPQPMHQAYYRFYFRGFGLSALGKYRQAILRGPLRFKMRHIQHS